MNNPLPIFGMTVLSAIYMQAPLAATVPVQAQDVIAFWSDAGPAMWFAKDADFDRRFRERFSSLHESAARGELAQWERTPQGALALLLLLDQYPRNAFRGTPRMYATDALARRVADSAVKSGFDAKSPPALRTFFVLPFAHSESLADQQRSVELAAKLGGVDLVHAEHHRDIVRRFGRFPHRNQLLGRSSTSEEQAYLDNGGYQG
ncbi:MAG TPA: DUF924 family protein [Steroidobacteraceae bacterium]|jgi:uncharacterized protein (DUF924 family)|nr:DUF924 family protein [Steroidobacteraceae bacterium]